jgi:hypothetical protein
LCVDIGIHYVLVQRFLNGWLGCTGGLQFTLRFVLGLWLVTRKSSKCFEMGLRPQMFGNNCPL